MLRWDILGFSYEIYEQSHEVEYLTILILKITK